MKQRKRSAAATKPRPLTESEVTFSVELEPCDIPWEGNAVVSGDDAADRAQNEWIRGRLETGHQEAWCDLKVTVTWEGFEGTDYLGAVSLDCGQYPPGEKVAREAEKFARDSDMFSEALADLNRVIAEHYAKLAKLV